jgi:hypothetical protein
MDNLTFPELPVVFEGCEATGPWGVADVDQCCEWSIAGNTMPESTGVVGIVLSVTHSLATGTTQTTQVGARSGPGIGLNSRMRLGQASKRNYDRIVMFGDVSSSGNCFAVVFPSNITSSNFFGSSNQRKGVGCMYYILEPKEVRETLGSTTSVAILDSYTSAFVLHNSVARSVKEVPYMWPEAGHTKYFAYHDRQIQLAYTTLKSDTCLGGYFCDRQKKFTSTMSLKPHCGCFSNSGQAPLVLDHVLSVNIPELQSENGQIVVKEFRSFRTQQLFADNRALRFASQTGQAHTLVTTSTAEMNKIRQAVKECVQYINSRGGWTVIGWVRRGVTADTSDTRNESGVALENMASESTKPHSSYLYPTDVTVVESDEYKGMMYKPGNVVAAAVHPMAPVQDQHGAASSGTHASTSSRGGRGTGGHRGI